MIVGRATVTGVHRLERQQLSWIAQELTVDLARGDVLPPIEHMRLNEEEKVTIHWRGANELVILGDRPGPTGACGDESLFCFLNLMQKAGINKRWPDLKTKHFLRPSRSL